MLFRAEVSKWNDMNDYMVNISIPCYTPCKIFPNIKCYDCIFFVLPAKLIDEILTSPIHFLLIDDIFDCIWEEDGIVLCTEVNPYKGWGCSSDGKDDILLRWEVEGDTSDSQLAGK